MNQKLIKLLDNKRFEATRHSYESKEAIFDITIIDLNGYTLYEKNCRIIADNYNNIPENERKYYDFINSNIKAK